MKNAIPSLLAILGLALPLAAQSTPVITTFAGTGSFVISGDGGPAAQAGLGEPWSLAVDGAGNVYVGVSDYGDRDFGSVPDIRIRRIDSVTGMTTTVVGGGAIAYPNDGQLATEISIGEPDAIAVDTAGNIYFADSSPIGILIRRVDSATHVITTIAGGGTPTDFTVYRVVPWVPAFASHANVFAYAVAAGLGDGGLATSACIGGLLWQTHPGGPFYPGGGLSGVDALAVDAAGNVYVAADFRVRRIDASTGVITTVAGNGAFQLAYSFGSNFNNPDFWPSGVYSGDGGPATAAGLSYMWGMTVDATGNLYVSDVGFASAPDTSNFNLSNPPPPGFVCEPMTYVRIRRIDAATGVITTVAGAGEFGFSGDGGLATNATFGYADGLAVDPSDTLYFADSYNAVIRKVDSSGTITSVVGTPLNYGFGGDGGPADQALLSDYIGDVAFDSAGSLYLSDWSNARIRKVTGLSPNSPPTANAGPDQGIHASGLVQLDGSASFDDNTPSANLSYSWTLSTRPLGSTAMLSNANTAAPAFIADLPGTYIAGLVVTDTESLQSSLDQVEISSTNLAPTANAGADQGSVVDQLVDLSGSASSDPELDPLTFFWNFTQLPMGSTAYLSNSFVAAPHFMPDLPGTYVIGLVVDDGFGPSQVDEVVITVITGEEFAENMTMLAINETSSLLSGSVTSAGNQQALVQFLSQAVQGIQSGNLAAARLKLQKSIERTDGCALRGTPDQNGPGRDWIRTCAAQGDVYATLVAALEAISP